MKVINICLAKKGGGLEQMAINYHNILENHISIFQNNSWISSKINDKNTFLINKWYQIKDLLDKEPVLFICHDKRSLFYLNLLKLLNYPILTCIVNHNHTKIKKTLNSDYSIIITKKMFSYYPKNYKPNKIFVLNNFSFNNKIFNKERKSVIKNIGFIGRLIERKGCLLMIKQLKNYIEKNDIIINIYGKGEEEELISKFIKNNNLDSKIVIHGWIDDISQCYLKNDLIIIPSLYEPFGVVIIDSFYYKCPTIISNKVLINDDITKDKDNCILYDIDNSNDLEEKIKLLNNNAKLINKITLNAFKTYNTRLHHKQAKINLKNIINKIEDIEENNLNIHHEFDKIKNRLLRNEYFTFVRFGDGEMNYIERDENIHEEHTTKKGEVPIKLSNLIKNSLEFKKNNYYVGIPCGCIEHRDNFRKKLYNNYTVNKSNLTFASLFGNIMNFRFKNEIIPILKNYPIILISNKRTNIQKMKDQGFNIIKWFSVDYNAWKNYQDIVDQVTNYQKENNIINHLFIFCAGPIANILAYQLVQQEDKNIYLDIGSSLDEELGLGKGTRNHNKLFGWKTMSTCYWNKPLKWYQISCDSKGKSKCFRLFLRIISLIYKIYIWLFNG